MNVLFAFQDERSALHLAAERGHLEVVQVLIGFGASIREKGGLVRTVLYIVNLLILMYFIHSVFDLCIVLYS